MLEGQSRFPGGLILVERARGGCEETKSIVMRAAQPSESTARPISARLTRSGHASAESNRPDDHRPFMESEAAESRGTRARAVKHVANH